jgi:NAD(P)-dependent dehydrogenase (short-subunit alcohol dehydrogenase family)
VIDTGSDPQTVAAARQYVPGIEVISSDAWCPTAVKSLVAEVKKKHGRIDVLFVNAGVAK